jgi:hypothetical protein
MSFPVLSFPFLVCAIHRIHCAACSEFSVRHAPDYARWKDYFDIWLLSDTLEFECEKLQKAIKKTFERRSTLLPSTRPSSLTTHFASINDKNWKIFLRRSKLQNEYTNEFEIIVEMIWHFLEIPLERLWTHTKVPKMHWIPKKGWV